MCLSPIKARLDEFGRIKFTHEGDLRLPCSKCTECRMARAFEWGTRVKHELSQHDESCFVTLTYNEENFPDIHDWKKHFGVFHDKLQKKLKRRIRFLVSHEYGSTSFRPHHHAILFGYNPPNQSFLKVTKKGENLYTSPELESLWTKGFSSIGTANEKTAYYIASYSLKGQKILYTDPASGEIYTFSDSMASSKRPAIGSDFFQQNQNQLVNSGDILPRYYLKKLKELNPTLHEHYENARMQKLKNRGIHEVLAKYTIDQQKISQDDSELRSTPDNSKIVNATKRFLKQERDEYHRKTKKDKK